MFMLKLLLLLLRLLCWMGKVPVPMEAPAGPAIPPTMGLMVGALASNICGGRVGIECEECIEVEVNNGGMAMAVDTLLSFDVAAIPIDLPDALARLSIECAPEAVVSCMAVGSTDRYCPIILLDNTGLTILNIEMFPS